MADTWTLSTPDGHYALNPTFAAPTYQPGGVDTNALFRREGRTVTQRVGDGLPTPGPLRLVGRVWRDDRDQLALAQELRALHDAVLACTSVTRTTDAGRYVYDDLAGGPPPAITPDGRGGWVVEIELWPARATSTFIPDAPTRVRTLSKAQEEDGNITLLTDTRRRDYVALIVHQTDIRDAPEVPPWLSVLGHATGYASGAPNSVTIAAGVAPANVSTLVVPDVPAFSRAVLVAIEGADAEGVQVGDMSTGSPNPMPGFVTPGGCLLILLEGRMYQNLFAAGQPGTAVAGDEITSGGSRHTRIVVQLVTTDLTGDLPLTSPIAGAWRAGLAIAVPLA